MNDETETYRISLMLDDSHPDVRALMKVVQKRGDTIKALQAENARLRSLPTSWEDREDDLTPEIEANNPLRHRDFKAWERAMFLVGNRHSKGALVALVAYLLSRAAITTQENPE